MSPFQGQMPLKLTGAKAGAGLTVATAQYKFVKLSADNTVVLCAAATDRPIGVLQAPVAATGDPVDVVVLGETQLQADVSTAFGNALGVSADGQATVVTPGPGTLWHAGTAVNVAGATSAGNLITAVVNCVNPPPAA
jgi:hypothetical protein